MSSCMLKLNPEKTDFIIFGSHAQLRKIDPYLPVRIFGKFSHPSAVKNLGVWFDPNFSFGDHIRNICKTCFIQMCASDGSDRQKSVQFQHAQIAVYSKHTW